MTSLTAIRSQIHQQYQANPNVHLNVSLKRPKIQLENTQARIIGVYPHIFQIEEYTTGQPKQHVLQYQDVLLGNIVILELEQARGD